MVKDRENSRYLPGVPFPPNLVPEPELAKCLDGARDVLVVVPSHGLRDTLTRIKPLLGPDARICWATKGFELSTGKLPHQVASEVLGPDIPVATLSGPTFAKEVAEGLPTAMTIASSDEAFARALAEAISSDNFRAYTSDDMIGVEVGGAYPCILSTTLPPMVAATSAASSAVVARASLEERSHFQKMVIRIGDFLILITVVLVVLIVMVSFFRHENYLEIARFALVLAVAAIPVALPAVLSVTLAVGAVNLARRQAIVSRLTTIEELAGVDVFCSDKTGTLTQNQMQVAEPVVFAGHDVADLFRTAALASKLENQDPIELPIFEYIKQKEPDADWQSYQQLSFIPFDPIRKRTEAEVQKGGDSFVAMKGAAQVMLGMAELDDEQTHAINQTVEELAGKGYRTLAVGRKRGDAPLELLGLLPLYDPPREDSKQVIADMNRDGVEVNTGGAAVQWSRPARPFGHRVM